MVGSLPNALKFAIKATVSFLLILYLAITIDWASLIRGLSGVHPGYYIISFIVVLLSTSFLAAKCFLLIEGSSIQHSFWALIKINIISRFYSLFLPPAVGPEMVRWYKITKNQSGKVFFMAASLFERAGFILVSLLASAVFLYFSPSSQQIEPLQRNLLPPLMALIALLFSLQFFFLSKSLHGLGRRLVFGLLPDSSIKNRMLRLYDNFFLTNRSPRLLVGITFLSIGWHIFFLVRNYLLFLALSLPLGFLDVAWMSSLVFLFQILPVSLSGLGVREGAFAYMFLQIDLPPEQGVAVGLLFFSQFLLLGGIGGIVELFESAKKTK